MKRPGERGEGGFQGERRSVRESGVFSGGGGGGGGAGDLAYHTGGAVMASPTVRAAVSPWRAFTSERERTPRQALEAGSTTGRPWYLSRLWRTTRSSSSSSGVSVCAGLDMTSPMRPYGSSTRATSMSSFPPVGLCAPTAGETPVGVVPYPAPSNAVSEASPSNAKLRGEARRRATRESARRAREARRDTARPGATRAETATEEDIAGARASGSAQPSLFFLPSLLPVVFLLSGQNTVVARNFYSPRRTPRTRSTWSSSRARAFSPRSLSFARRHSQDAARISRLRSRHRSSRARGLASRRATRRRGGRAVAVARGARGRAFVRRVGSDPPGGIFFPRRRWARGADGV